MGANFDPEAILHQRLAVCLLPVQSLTSSTSRFIGDVARLPTAAADEQARRWTEARRYWRTQSHEYVSLQLK